MRNLNMISKKSLSFIIGSVFCATSVVAKAPVSRVDEIRKLVASSQFPTLNLNLTSAEQAQMNATPFRFFSSIEIKDVFQKTILDLQQDERIGKPLDYNPGQDVKEHRDRINGYRQKACLAFLQKNVKDGEFLQDMERLYLDLSAKQQQSSQSQISSELNQKLVTATHNQMEKDAALESVANPEAALGQLIQVESFGGSHLRLKFKSFKAPVSLTMLLSLLSEKDSAFIRTLDCAAGRLRLLTATPEALNKNPWATSFIQLAKNKWKDALEANQTLKKLNPGQRIILLDTLLQLERPIVLTNSQFTAKQAELFNQLKQAKGNETQAAEISAQIKMIQVLDRELGDFEEKVRADLETNGKQ